MKANRGMSIITALLAGLVIGLFAGGYIFYAWVPPERVLKDSHPYNLAFGSEFPQYREIYLARVANRFRGLGASEAAMLEAYDLLGVTTGDVSLVNAHSMVLAANAVVTRDLQRDPALRRFNENDQLALTSLEQALKTAIDTGQGPKPEDIKPGAPAQARSRSQLIGGLLLVLIAAVAGGIVYLVDQSVGRVAAAPVVNDTSYEVAAEQDASGLVSPSMQSSASAATSRVPPASYTPPPASSAAPAATAATLVNAPSSEALLMSTPPCVYSHGDDRFDEDFAINGSMGELIGECGASIVDRLGLDTPARVSALAVWVFDKHDFQSTTKVLMSPFAYNDPTIRSKLTARGDTVLAQNTTIEVLTSTLRVEIVVSGLQFNTDNNPTNGYFQQATLTFYVYRRQTA